MKYSIFAFVMLLSGLVLVIPSSYAMTSTVPITDYNKQKLLQQDYLWHLGKNLSVGDSYTYKICDPKTIQTTASNYHYFVQGNDDHNSSTCYTIKLDFVNVLTSNENQINDQRNLWVVQAAIDGNSAINDNLRYSVFYIDTQTFEITSADHNTKKYADSLQKTLFSLHKYTAPEPQILQIGEGWGEVTEALQSQGENPHMTVLNNNQEFSVTQNQTNMIDKQNITVTRDLTDVFKIGYEIDIQDPVIFDQKKNKLVPINKEDNNNVTTSFLISSQLPFPLSGESYNPVYLVEPQKEFEFELLVFQTKNKNIDFEKFVIDETPKDDGVDLPITETGKIRLIFPQDEDVISEEAEVEIIPEDDNEVIDDITEDDDTEIIPDDGQEVISEDDVEITSNDVSTINNDKVDYSKIVGLVILLSVMIAGFVIFKKFRESGFKKTLLKQKPSQQYQSAKKKKIIIPFNDKLHIDIQSKEKV